MKTFILIESKSDALGALRNAEVKLSSAIRSMPKPELERHDLENSLSLIEATYNWIHKQVHSEFDDELDEADAELENERGQWTQCPACKESQPTVDPTNGQCQNGCGEENADRRGVDGNLK